MKSFTHPNPEAAAPGEIVGFYPVTLSPEEGQLLGNHLFAANQNVPLCHYMKEKYFQHLLKTATLSAKRLDLYDDDPLEGLYPEANRQGFAPADAQLLQQMNAHRNIEEFLTSQAIHRKHCYAHCWFGIPSEDADMWEKYGDHGEGVCIVTSTYRLLGAILKDPTTGYELGKVTYWPEDKPLPDLHSSTVMFRKQPKYADENEVRLLSQIKAEHLPKTAEGYLLPCSERLAVSVNLSVLVAGIVVGPRMREQHQLKLIETAHAKIPRARIARSRFDVSCKVVRLLSNCRPH